MRERRYGRIVNVASTSGPGAGVPRRPRLPRREGRHHRFDPRRRARGGRRRHHRQRRLARWIATGAQLTIEHTAGSYTPLGRSGTPAEVAAAVRFLADPTASFVTAQQIVVDGGNSLPEDRSWRRDRRLRRTGRPTPVVLITGAAGGIGGAAVDRFVAGGWRVAAVDINEMPSSATATCCRSQRRSAPRRRLPQRRRRGRGVGAAASMPSSTPQACGPRARAQQRPRTSGTE